VKVGAYARAYAAPAQKRRKAAVEEEKEEADPYLAAAREWVRLGATIVGGCGEGPGAPGGSQVSVAFPTANRFCAARLCGRAGRLAADNGGFRPRAVSPAHINALSEGGAPRHGRRIHLHTPLYILPVILHTKQTGGVGVELSAPAAARRVGARAGAGRGGPLVRLGVGVKVTLTPPCILH
jgi:hypothetical protein